MRCFTVGRCSLTHSAHSNIVYQINLEGFFFWLSSCVTQIWAAKVTFTETGTQHINAFRIIFFAYFLHAGFFSYDSHIFKLSYIYQQNMCVCVFDFDTFYFLIRLISAQSIVVCIHLFGFCWNTLMHLSECFPVKDRKSQIKDLFNVENVISNIDLDVRCHNKNCIIQFYGNFFFFFILCNTSLMNLYIAETQLDIRSTIKIGQSISIWSPPLIISCFSDA